MDEISIIIADAHKLVTDCLAKAIQAGPFFIAATTTSGRKLIDLAERLEPDLIIMDTVIPDLNGVDTALEILSARPRTKILALSAISDRHHILEMLNTGISGYILKSSPFDEIPKAVKAILNNQIYLCPNVTAMVVETALATRTPDDCFSILSKREREVLQLISEGHTSKEIANRLYISVKTVQIHRGNLKKKLCLDSTAALTRFAVSKGLTSLEHLPLADLK